MPASSHGSESRNVQPTCRSTFVWVTTMRVTAIKKTLGRWQVRLIRDSGTLVPRDAARVTGIIVGVGGSTACTRTLRCRVVAQASLEIYLPVCSVRDDPDDFTRLNWPPACECGTCARMRRPEEPGQTRPKTETRKMNPLTVRSLAKEAVPSKTS
jgi:hypothetical protein